MRTREEIKGDLLRYAEYESTGVQRNTQIIAELLLDIRDLLQNPLDKNSSGTGGV